MLASCFMLSLIPTQIKASTDAETAKAAIISTETARGTDQLKEIQSIDLSALSSSESTEALKEASPLKSEQNRHSRRYQNRHADRDVDVTIRSDQRVHDDGYYRGHSHGVAYIGGGGALVLILILILIL